MEFSIAIAGVTALSFIFCFFFLWPRSKGGKYKEPPKAGGAWPIIGHLHLFIGGSSGKPKLPHYTLSSMADKYGPIFTIWLGVNRVLVVSSWELVKELFTTRDVFVASRPKMMSGELLGYDHAMFGFSPYGAYWRDIRKLISVELLSSRRLELLKSVRVSETAQSVNELYKLWEQKKDGSGRVPMEMRQWFGHLNLNVMLKMVVGKRFHSVGGDGKETRLTRDVLRDFFQLAGLFVPADNMPYLGWLDIGGYEKKMKEIAKQLDSLLAEWLKEHRQNQDKSKLQDFMDVMISVVEDANVQGQYDADTIIKSTCMNLVVGGGETTTVMLVWTLALLLNNRHALKKVQEELDLHIGRERQVNESDVDNLVYFQAVVKESLRLYPAAPLSAYREITEDIVVGGYNVPKGTKLIVNMTKLHRDPKIWPEAPLEFRPERFLTTHKDINVKGQDFELIPFGAGRRICPGWNLGLHMLHLVLATLLHSFDLSTPLDELVDMSETGALTNMKATPLNILASPRLSPSLY